MKCAILILLCAVVTLSLASERRKRSALLTLRATPRVAVEGLTNQLKLDCRPPPIGDVLLAVLIHLEKVDENGTVTLVASHRINALEEMEDNRTSVESYLQQAKADAASFLSVVIQEPAVSDDGEYHCRFAYIDVKLRVHSVAAKVNVTVTEIPPPNYVPDMSCDCEQIWAEIDNLKATLVAENKELKAKNGGAAVVQSGDSCRASFSARFATRHGYAIVGDEPAIFDDVISSTGDAYDPTSGIFTAPCSGQYFFTVTLRSHQDLDSGYVDGVLMVDGEPRARTSVFIDAPIENIQTATNGVVLTLNEGQKVNVIIKSTSTGDFVGEEYSIFSGFFLSP